jgi:hypothetical protein
MDVAVSFPLRQFSEVFRIRDAAGQPYVLIGGQAVNYWAERYLVAEPELGKLPPFTSEFIDFNGCRDDVQRIAQQLALPPSYPAKVARRPCPGSSPATNSKLDRMLESQLEQERTCERCRNWGLESFATP